MTYGADIDVKNFVGKKIKALDISAVNVIKFTFTDGSVVELEAAPYGNGLCGIAEVRHEG